jgi:hypothetical protein
MPCSIAGVRESKFRMSATDFQALEQLDFGRSMVDGHASQAQSHLRELAVSERAEAMVSIR